MSSLSEVADTGMGRECATSAISAPRVTTIDTSAAWASSISSIANARQRNEGSTPWTSTTSRPSEVFVATSTRVVRQLIRRRPFSSSTRGRLTWKS